VVGLGDREDPAVGLLAQDHSAPGDRRQDLQLGAGRDLRLEPVAEADVVPVDVDVDEAPQRPSSSAIRSLSSACSA
jgi:hypothetical protein